MTQSDVDKMLGNSVLSEVKILIADDEPLMQELLKSMLNRYGAQSMEAVGNGTDALKKCISGAYHMLFLDIDMPGKNGLQCLKEIREQDNNMFVAIVSGHSSLQNVRAARDLGVGGFLVKPYSAKKVEQVLRNYLNSR